MLGKSIVQHLEHDKYNAHTVTFGGDDLGYCKFGMSHISIVAKPPLLAVYVLKMLAAKLANWCSILSCTP